MSIFIRKFHELRLRLNQLDMAILFQFGNNNPTWPILVTGSAVVPIGVRGSRQSVKFNTFGNARLVDEILIFFPMFLGFIFGLIWCAEDKSPLIFESHDGPGYWVS